MILVVAEKPSVARDISKFLGASKGCEGYYEGNGYRVTWCVGHLVGLALPNEYGEQYQRASLESLPIFPEKYKMNVYESSAHQFKVVKALMNDASTTEIICGTDAGREGQLIYQWVYNLAGCKKPDKRLWISSLTEKGIKEGFSSLKDNKAYHSLFLSAEKRAQADWLVGMNGSRMMSCVSYAKLSVGRVQTPTLAMIVTRQHEIDKFIPKPYFHIQGIFKEVGFLRLNEEGKPDIETKDEASAIVAKIDGKKGTVEEVSTAKKSEERPQLYDLTDLQREANMKYGLSAQETLTIAQALYEKHKIITYPRTDSKYISDDVAETIKKVLGSIGVGWVESQPIIKQIVADGLNLDKRIVDGSKVSDHHAIIPNENAANFTKLEMSDMERKVYLMIAAKLLAAVSGKFEYLETKVRINVDGEIFATTYRKTEILGWKNIYKTLLKSTKEEDETSIAFKKGEVLDSDGYELLEKMTKPPKPYNDATLLSAMENVSRKVDSEHKEFLSSGLGTPATRANIIEKLISVGYVERNKKNLIPTVKGIELISVVPEKFKQPELTAEWEEKLEGIRAGKVDAEAFLDGIKGLITTILNDVVSDSSKYKISSSDGKSFSSGEGERKAAESLGACPRCGKPVYESPKGFSCSGYKDSPSCTFTIWKDNKFIEALGKKLTKTMVKSFLSKGTAEVSGIKKKSGDGTYSITLGMDAEWVNSKGSVGVSLYKKEA